MTTRWGIAHREIGKWTVASWADERFFGTYSEAAKDASALRRADLEYRKHLSGEHGEYVGHEFLVLLRWGDEPVWPLPKAIDEARLGEMEPAVQALVRRGGVTWPEVQGLRCDSNEWDAIILRMDDEAFLRKTQHTLANCSMPKHGGITYDEHLGMVYVPELIRRWMARVAMALQAEETLEGIRGMRYERFVSAYPAGLMRDCDFDDLHACRMAVLRATHPGIVNATYGKQAHGFHVVAADSKGRVLDPSHPILGDDAAERAARPEARDGELSDAQIDLLALDEDDPSRLAQWTVVSDKDLPQGESLVMRTNEIVRERCGEKSKEIWHREGEILGYTQCVESAREKVALVHKAFEAFFGDERTHAGVVTGLGPVEVTTPPSPVMKMDGGLRAVDAVALKANLDPEDVAKVTALLGRVLAAEQRAAAAEASLAQIRARDERSRLAVANAARDPRYAGSGRLIDLDALDLAKSWAPEDLAKVEALLVRVTAAEGRVMSAEARADLADERAKEKNDWPVAFRQPGERIPLEALRPEDFKEGEKGTSIYGLVVRKTLAEARVVELEAENARLREQAVSAGERASCLGDRCGTLEAEAADLKRQLKARR